MMSSGPTGEGTPATMTEIGYTQGPTDPPIESHRLLGDGRSTALVLPDGSIDWWCAPEPDSSPLLWRLLDPGGPAAYWVGATPSGLGRSVAGPGLRTTVEVDGVLVQLLDGLVDVAGTVVLARLARSVDQATTLTHELGVGIGGFGAPRPAQDGGEGGHRKGWGRGRRSDATAPSWTSTGSSPTARVGGQTVTLSGTGESTVDGGIVRTTIEVTPHPWSGIVVSPAGQAAIEIEAIAAQIERVELDAIEAITTCQLPDALSDVAVDALAVLTACTCAGSGAIIASPTTSLPEVIGGDRQFDYRYCWLRDSAQAVSVAAQLGKHGSARELFSFLSNQGADRLLESPLFDVRGGDIPEERELDRVSGWHGSRPVRVGNDAAGQIQHDVLGIVMESITAFDELGDGLRRTDLGIVRAFADRALQQPDASNGIWELRTPTMVVSADIGRWLALDRAVALARRHRRVRWARRHRRWARVRDRVGNDVLAALRADGGLPRAYGEGDETHDASALLAVIYGLLDPHDPRANALVDATISALADGPFLRRYAGVDDGFAPGEGAFIPASWWAVSALAIVGRKDEARQRADAMREVLPGIQPEEVDVASGTGRGNVPLVWSHTEAARAAILLDRA